MRYNKIPSIQDCLKSLEEDGWGELVCSRWKDDIIQHFKLKYPAITDDILNELLTIILV